MGCSGNAGETCGGAGRLNVFATGPAWVSLGCYSDQPYQRTLTTVGNYDGQLTIAKCQASCSALGFAYAGVEYGNECHCGSQFENGGAVASDGSAGCSFQCAGDSTEVCGGSQRLSMYEYINVDGSVMSTTSTSSGSSGSSGSTPTPPKTPSVPSDLPSGWSYTGCYVDLAHGRVLDHQQPDSPSNTVESCIAACGGLGFSIAGLEYSSQCFCDNAIQNQGVLLSSDSNCAMTCSGNAGEICGGPGLLSIYSTSTPTVTPVATIEKTNLPESWRYQGCYSDSIAVRDFGSAGVELEFETLNTAEYCLTQCYSMGYTAGGTEYSKQCCEYLHLFVHQWVMVS